MNEYFLAFGILILLVTWLPLLLRKLPLSLPIVCMAAGFFLAQIGVLNVDLSALRESKLAEGITAAVVTIALMGAGLKLDRRFGWRAWGSAWRLLGIAMPLTILAVAALAFGIGGYTWPLALFIGAALAPTDPVLASDVEVGPPGTGEEGEVRFALTSEAGFNDGLAFPVVHLALGLATFQAIGPGWIFTYFIWKIALGVGCGWLLGLGFGLLAFRVPRLQLSQSGDGLAALGMTLLTYVATEAIGGYGFIAVFIMALRLRAVHWDHEFHRAMSDFADQVVRAVAMLLMVLFGSALASGLLEDLQWRDAIVGVALLLVIRPVSGWLSLIGSPHPAISRAASSFFGIRGMGTLYYLAYAHHERIEFQSGRLHALIGFAVLISVIVHGLTVTPVMRKLDRMRTSRVKVGEVDGSLPSSASSEHPP